MIITFTYRVALVLAFMAAFGVLALGNQESADKVASSTSKYNEKMTKYHQRLNNRHFEALLTKPGVIFLKNGMVIEMLKFTTKTRLKNQCPTEEDSVFTTFTLTSRDGGNYFSFRNDFISVGD